MKQKIKFLLATIMMLAGITAQATTTVTWNSTDFTQAGVTSFKGIVASCPISVESMMGGNPNVGFKPNGTASFSTTNSDLVFTKIEVSGGWHSSEPYFTGEGWSNSEGKRVWTGQSASVSFNLWSLTNNFGDAPWSIVFTLAPPAPATVNVTSVSLSQTEAAMTVGGDALTLTATVAPDDATDKTVTWTTSNASVATVANGVVTAVGAGTATITATATNGTDVTTDDKTATCTVTVSPAGYSVTLKESTEDATSWQGKAGTGDYQELPLTGLEAGTAVSVKYSGTKKVKSVKAKKKAAAPAYTMAANATAGDLGKLICTDGHIHTYNADAACTKSRVAMIAYVGSEAGVAGYTHGLALALTDESSSGMYWNDAKTACTNKNTSATVESASWMLPSKDQWNKMIDACKNVLGTNDDSRDLRDGFTSVGGSNLVEKDYWSSTEINDTQAWMFNFGYDWWYDYPKGTEAYPQVRACLAF